MRGQYFSFDAIVGSVIFILALVSLLSAWQSLRTTLEHQSNPLGFEAMRIGETLLGPGSPDDVPCRDMDIAGVAMSWEDRRISAKKLKSCTMLTEEEMRGKLSTSYGLSIIIRDTKDKNSWMVGGNISKVDTSLVEDIARVRKIATVYDETLDQEEIVTLDIYIYR